jgi:hypothetical protein
VTIGRTCKFGPSSTTRAISAARRSGAPSSKPPARPTVQAFILSFSSCGGTRRTTEAAPPLAGCAHKLVDKSIRVIGASAASSSNEHDFGTLFILGSGVGSGRPQWPPKGRSANECTWRTAGSAARRFGGCRDFPITAPSPHALRLCETMLRMIPAISTAGGGGGAARNFSVVNVFVWAGLSSGFRRGSVSPLQFSVLIGTGETEDWRNTADLVPSGMRLEFGVAHSPVT